MCNNKYTALLKPLQLSVFSNTAFKAVQFGGFTKKSIIYSLRQRCRMKTVQSNYSIFQRDTPTFKEGEQCTCNCVNRAKMPLCLSLLRDEELKRFAGNPAGLPGYTTVRTNNVLLEATKPEQTNQSGGGGVVGS